LEIKKYSNKEPYKTIHELHRKKMNGVSFKNDFEKGINWGFYNKL
jgi:hypothetical protein